MWNGLSYGEYVLMREQKLFNTKKDENKTCVSSNKTKLTEK